MKNSLEWWQEVKNDSAKLNDWLIRQYRGEVTAADRIEQFAQNFATAAKDQSTLRAIAFQEKIHAKWVLELLKNRNLSPMVENAEERYWKETLPEIESFETGAAVGAHAETMRLERIRVIAEDDQAPSDIRKVFQKILKDEEWHAEAFTKMAGIKALEETSAAHLRGKNALGLEA